MKKALLAFASFMLLTLVACTSDAEEPEASPTADPAATAEATNEPADESVSEASSEPTASTESEDMAEDASDSSEASSETDVDATATPVTGVLFTYMYAVQLLESQLYEEAIPQLNIVVRRLPDLGRGWYYRGMAYRHEGQFEFALEDLNKAIELKPEFGPAYKERGILFSETGEPAKAIEDLETALSLYHPTREAYHIGETRQVLNELRSGQ